MATPHRPASPCLSRLRAIISRMDRLNIVIKEKLAHLKNETHELRRVEGQLTEAELSEQNRQIQTEREQLAAVMKVFHDMLDQLGYVLDFYEEEI
ncbi:hypothetical protein ALT_3338 [Aspergillus lentulus]|uniref:Uncharacterized protein n=1 Tax=Aspergillus lentulus TaxID=293939 RepID=A0AAN4PFY7_ASPLE|nr:hypothetical protein ALT_3338 [Aspergillus lentulus]